MVHAVSYSLLLLNTDLHVAELSTRMSRSQFVRNTLTAIQMQLQPTTARPLSVSDLTYDDCGITQSTGFEGADVSPRSKRSDSITSWNSISRETLTSSPAPNTVGHGPPSGRPSNGSTPSVHVPHGQDLKTNGFSPPPAYGRTWEIEMEGLLKVGFLGHVLYVLSFLGSGYVQCDQECTNFTTTHHHPSNLDVISQPCNNRHAQSESSWTA